MSSNSAKEIVSNTPDPEEILAYCLVGTIAHHGSVFEAATRTLGTHFVRPLSENSLLAVEQIDLLPALAEFEAYRAHVPSSEEQGFYGRYLVKDSWASEIPDLFTSYSHSSFFCSEAARNVIESVDPEMNQFIPITIETKSPVERLSKPFYGVVPNRYLYLPPEKDAIYPKVRADFVVSPLMNMLLQRVLMNEAAKELLDGWPLWAHPYEANRPFFSKRLFQALRDAGLTGLTETSLGQNVGGENPIGHVFG
jgi:hypothetical protein